MICFFCWQSSIMVIVCYDCEYNTCSFNNKTLLIEFVNVVDCVGEVGKRRNVTMGSWQASVGFSAQRRFIFPFTTTSWDLRNH
jgi:hypothetical protein